MDRRDDLRSEITGADATGMVADESFIAEAETLAPLMRPPLPFEDLHAALPEGHGAHETIDKLHAEINASSPSPAVIERHVGSLRVIPEIEAAVANWWDKPETQRFFANLGQIGL